MYCFGIDVGGTTVKCGLFQTDGTLVEKWEIPTRKENKGEYILPDVAETIQNKISEKGIDKAEVAGVGVGIPGPINAQGEAACAVNLYWGFRPVAKELSELTGLTAKAGNDANVAALGEAWKGAAAGSQNVIMVTLGTGVGGGIISDGRIVAGAHGAGGEIGHANICHEETAACNCETVDVWSSMLLQQELSAWPKRLWQKAVRTVCSEIQRALRRRTYWMPLSQGMLLLSVLWMK